MRPTPAVRIRLGLEDKKTKYTRPHLKQCTSTTNVPRVHLITANSNALMQDISKFLTIIRSVEGRQETPSEAAWPRAGHLRTTDTSAIQSPTIAQSS
jgi:hypothetical protein